MDHQTVASILHTKDVKGVFGKLLKKGVFLETKMLRLLFEDYSNHMHQCWQCQISLNSFIECDASGRIIGSELQSGA
jgi:hypothetical protein